MHNPQRASSLFCLSRTPTPTPSLRRPAAPLNAAREPFPTFGQRAILTTSDHGEGQPFRLKPAGGAARRASEDQAAKIFVENEGVVCDFDALSRSKTSSRFARVFEGHAAASKGNGQPSMFHTSNLKSATKKWSLSSLPGTGQVVEILLVCGLALVDC